jgi:type I restriction enzyme S subunit
MRRLKHAATVMVSNVDKKSVEGDETVRLCNYTDVYYNERITPDLSFMEATATPAQISRLGLRAGDVLVTKDSETAEDIAIPAYVVQDLPGVVCGYHLAVVRPRPGVDGRFLFWVLSSKPARDHFTVSAAGVTRFGLRYDAFESLAVPSLPLPEQRAIASYLDEETARIDEMISSQECLVGLLQEHLSAAMDEIVWHSAEDTIPLGRVTEPGRPIMYGIVLPGPNVEDGVLLVKGGDVKPGRLSPENLNRTTPEIEAAFARARLKANDVVYAIRGSIGDAQLVPASVEGANITQDVARIAPGSGVEPRWLLYAVQSRRFFASMEAEARGATIRGVNIWSLKKGRVPNVAIEDQRRAAIQLDELSGRVERSAREIKQQTDLLREHRQALVTVAVTGGLEAVGRAA